MTRIRLNELLEKIRTVRAAMLGDICLDVYWFADMRRSELSRETPHFPLPVMEECMSLGGGGNVAVNLAALAPTSVVAIGVAGEDWRGVELLRLFSEQDIDASSVRRVRGMVTNAYCKPMRAGISKLVYEDPRLDFHNYIPLDPVEEDAIIALLDKIAPEIDVLCVSDQLPCGVVTERVREHVMRLARNGLTVVVDSRDRIGLYREVILKPNEIEGVCAAGIGNVRDVDGFAQAALVLSQEKHCGVLMTIGSNGSLYADGKTVTHIHAHDISGDIDFVGAGDTFLSGFSLAVAAGASYSEAAFIATLCSEVTIQKIGTTGTARAEEVLAWYDTVMGRTDNVSF